MADLQRTPLFEQCRQLGAKMIDFGGWQLPVQFSGIALEHEAVRTKCGLFDVSHMGEIMVTGKRACDFLQYLLTNDVASLPVGKAQYNFMCDFSGGVIDDLIIYRLTVDEFLLCVNASRINRDYEWILEQKFENVEVKNCSETFAQIAVQGPLAEIILQKTVEIDLAKLPKFSFANNVLLADERVLIARTGYTGEDGFEIYGTPEAITKVWEYVLNAGSALGIVPCGLGARDTLRLEAGLPLYGQELTEEISPIEAGMGFAVKVDKDADFIGKDILKFQKQNGTTKKRVWIETINRGVPRHGYELFDNEKLIGVVTSGTQIPITKRNIGLALIDKAYSEIGTKIEVEIRGKRILAEIINKQR